MSVSEDRIQAKIDMLLTQYRESPKLQHVIRTYLVQIEEARCALEAIPSFFNLNTAVEDQLTIIGKQLGFGREHCVCTTQPVFGWECDNADPTQNITTFCDENGVWSGCDSAGVGTVTITDDEIYRKLLKSRAIQTQKRFDLASICEAVQIIFGDQASVARDSRNQVVIVVGRDLTAQEQSLIQVIPRVFPLALGVESRFHFGESSQIFGFGDGWSGFCTTTPPDPVEILTNDSDFILANDGSAIIIDIEQPTDTPQWLCSTDVNPYGCD